MPERDEHGRFVKSRLDDSRGQFAQADPVIEEAEEAGLGDIILWGAGAVIAILCVIAIWAALR